MPNPTRYVPARAEGRDAAREVAAAQFPECGGLLLRETGEPPGIRPGLLYVQVEMAFERLAVHQHRRGMGERAAHIVQDGESIGVQIAPVQQGHIGKRWRAAQVSHGVSAAMHSDRTRYIGKRQCAHQVLAHDRKPCAAHDAVQLANRQGEVDDAFRFRAIGLEIRCWCRPRSLPMPYSRHFMLRRPRHGRPIQPRRPKRTSLSETAYSKTEISSHFRWEGDGAVGRRLPSRLPANGTQNCEGGLQNGPSLAVLGTVSGCSTLWHVTGGRASVMCHLSSNSL